MRNLLICFFMLIVTAVCGQSSFSKPFWNQDFSAGKLPEGWKNVDVYNRGCAWVVTDQPYPGSYQFQQQAPPIASHSRGFHLQYQAGYIVDEDQPSWNKRKEYPDAYIQSAPIDCRGKKSVVLRFQQTFRYNNYKAADSAGLYAGVSADGITWHDINVTEGIAPASDMSLPITEQLDISEWAALQQHVFIRFYWRGYFSWYWMIDDMELTEAPANDLGIVRLVSQDESSNNFGKHDSLLLRIKNYGSSNVSNDFSVSCILDGSSKALIAHVSATEHPLTAHNYIDVAFPTVDLSQRPSHRLFFTIGRKDDNAQNDTLRVQVSAAATTLGKLTRLSADRNQIMIDAGPSKLRIIFYEKDIFRIWLAPDGIFTDPAGKDIVAINPSVIPTVKVEDANQFYAVSAGSAVLRIYKSPLLFALYDASNKKMIWKEEKPIVFGTSTSQFLERQSDEYFYGCGMQNGYFSHRDKNILIEKGGGWDDGGRSNPAPFYMSTAGYGVFRNTYDAGNYNFGDTLALTHREDRFDAFYFYGSSLKTILNKYTLVTGRPFLMPRWALSLGDANCYNKADRQKNPQTTPAVITAVADKYVESNMPRGWILPNDGYGCGYVKLDSVVKELSKRGFHTGLWTENGVDKIATEVGRSGTRLCKLDVAWVGPGYKFALDACKAAYKGIEDNSNARGFVWSVMGWAGTQHYSTVWSGDQSGNWEYIRFHIPTVIGAGLSAQNAATGDVDGIFGGSDSTYTRDLQWKCFTPVFMVMSGWAKKDKQPYISEEPFRSINRNYLALKMRLTPYMYTYCHEAYATGTPTVRGMVLEYPNDKITHDRSTQYQFMAGEWLLVAPVYKSESKRDSIYLPAGKWTDYWSGEIFSGGRWLNNYPAPLDKLPLFVKDGAIVPMYPAMNYDGERRADTLTLDIYPSRNSSFNLYEDDGITRDHRKGAFTTTKISVESSSKTIVTIHRAHGQYDGMYQRRCYILKLHKKDNPAQMSLNGKRIAAASGRQQYLSTNGPAYYTDADDRNGTINLRTGFLDTKTTHKIVFSF